MERKEKSKIPIKPDFAKLHREWEQKKQQNLLNLKKPVTKPIGFSFQREKSEKNLVQTLKNSNEKLAQKFPGPAIKISKTNTQSTFSKNSTQNSTTKNSSQIKNSNSIRKSSEPEFHVDPESLKQIMRGPTSQPYSTDVRKSLGGALRVGTVIESELRRKSVFHQRILEPINTSKIEKNSFKNNFDNEDSENFNNQNIVDTFNMGKARRMEPQQMKKNEKSILKNRPTLEPIRTLKQNSSVKNRSDLSIPTSRKMKNDENRIIQASNIQDNEEDVEIFKQLTASLLKKGVLLDINYKIGTKNDANNAEAPVIPEPSFLNDFSHDGSFYQSSQEEYNNNQNILPIPLLTGDNILPPSPIHHDCSFNNYSSIMIPSQKENIAEEDFVLCHSQNNVINNVSQSKKEIMFDGNLLPPPPLTIAQSSVQFANKENSARVSVLDDILPLPPSFSSKTDEIPNSNESTSPSSNSMLRRSQGQLFHSKNAPDQTMLEEEDTCCLFFAPKSSEPVIKSHYPLFSHCSTDSNESSNVDVFQNYANQGLSESVENAPDNVDDFENENNVFMKCKDKSLLNINDFNHIQVVPTPPAPLVNSVQTEHESVCELTEDELELKALDEQEAMLKNQIIQNQIRELETPSRLDKPVSVSMIPKGSNFYTLETWKLEMNK